MNTSCQDITWTNAEKLSQHVYIPRPKWVNDESWSYLMAEYCKHTMRLVCFIDAYAPLQHSDKNRKIMLLMDIIFAFIVRQKYTKACFEVYTKFHCWSCYTMVSVSRNHRVTNSHLWGNFFIHSIVFLVWHKWQFWSLIKENLFLSIWAIIFMV